MKRLTKEFIIKFIAENNLEYQSTQSRLCVPIIDRIYRKMLVGINFTEIKVDSTYICDGHHRYIASLLAKYVINTIPSKRTSASQVTDWKSVEFDTEDWDTLAKIKFLNEQDAFYNNLSVDKLIELVK